MRRGPSPLAQSLAAKFAVVSLNTSQGTASPQSLSEPRRRQRLRSFPTPPPSRACGQPGSPQRPLERRERSAAADTPGTAQGITEGILAPCPGAGRAEGASVRGAALRLRRGDPAAILQRQAGGEAPRQLRRGARGSRRGGRAAQGYELKSRRRPAEFGLILPGVPPSSRPSYRQPPLPGRSHPRQPCLSQGRPRHAVRAAAAQGEQPLQADPGEPPAPLLSPPPAAASPSSSLSHAGLARCPPGHFARRRSWPRLSTHGCGGRARPGGAGLPSPPRPGSSPLPSFLCLGPAEQAGRAAPARVGGRGGLVWPPAGRGREGGREGARQSLPGPPAPASRPPRGLRGEPGLRRRARSRSPPRAARKENTSKHSASLAGLAFAWLVPICASFPARASLLV